MFHPLLPTQRCERVRKRLRRVRRAAGEIRDVDVLLERSLPANPDTATADGVGRQELLDCRQRLERDLRSVARDEADDDLKRRVKRIVRRIRWRGADAEPNLATAASALLSPIAQRCLKNAASDLTAVRRLHRFRVSVKRLRYAGEFVQDGLDAAAYARLQALLAGLQQRLGGVCDHAAAIRLLDGRRDASRDKADAARLSGLIAREQASLATLQSEFVAWWEPVGQQDFNQAVQACLR
jgi:CHAD domain-containing protein